VLREGAWADVLLVDGDPTQDIGVLRDYERNLAVIIKDGKGAQEHASLAASTPPSFPETELIHTRS
jgi:imidazolonepropionase-like amidohydrolase